MFGDVPVMVTFFISSSVCRHCKTTYDVFGVLLLNLRKCGYQTRFLFYQLRGLSASASGLNTSPGPIIFSCMENHVWSLFSQVLLTCVCTICIIHYTIMQRVFFLKQLRFTSSVSLILISVHYDYVCRSYCKCANKAMLKVIMFILFCYFHNYNYQCSLIIASKMLGSR